jgi:hypothetical protein
MPSSARNILRLAVAAGFLAIAAGQPKEPVPQSYKDPKSRLTLQIPAGWNKIQMNDDGVQFNNAGAFVSMLVLPGSDVDLTLASMGSSTGKIWKNFTEERRGDATFGGLPAKYVTYSGLSPIGMDSYIQLLAATDRQSTYVLMTQASKSDFARRKAIFDSIERSFTLLGAANAPASPPAPAGVTSAVKAPPAVAPAAKPRATAPAVPPAVAPPAAAPATALPATAPAVPPAARVAAAALPADGSVYRMKLARIVDERSFEQPMTALTMLIPLDWQFQGGVQYGQGAGCHANLAQLVFRATSPDGRLAIELFPGNTWQWTDDVNMRNMMTASNQQMARLGAHGCDIMAPMSADAYLRRNVVPSVRRSARVENSEQLPDTAPRLAQEARELEQTAARQGVRVNIRTDAGRVRVSYSQGSEAVEEWLTAMTFTIGMAGPSFNVRTGRGGQVLYYTNSVDHLFGLRAPQGQLDAQDRLFQLILGTVKVNPQWQARVEQAIANLNAQDIKGANDRSAIATKLGQDMAKMQQEVYQNAENSREHSMANWSQYLRGVQTFRNPATGDTVELSNGYDHAWAGPDSTYVVTNLNNFNPNSSFDGHWTKLEAVTH